MVTKPPMIKMSIISRNPKTSCTPVGGVCLTSLFYRDGGRELNQVSPSDLRVTVLDRLQQVERVDQASVGAVFDLGLEADRPISTPLPAIRVAIINCRSTFEQL